MDATTTETFQISPEAAELYEARFVPGIFAEWAPRLVGFAHVEPGDDVLDVACGTGIVARTAAGVVQPGGSVLGVDLNEAMLAVARRLRPDLDWRRGDAARLPVEDGAVGVALCQMALMFMPDPQVVLGEMARAARRTVAVLVPAAVEDQPAYRRFTDVVARHAGPAGASAVGAYWAAGDVERLTRQFVGVGLTKVTTRTITGTAAFDSIDDFVATEVEGSPLIDRIDQATYDAIREECRTVLADVTTGDGAVEAPLVCHLVRGNVV